MAITTLDPKTALVVIDLQQGIVSLPTVHPVADIIARAVALCDAFRRHGLPIVFVRVDGAPSGRTDAARNRGERPAGWADLVSDLKQRPEDYLVMKRTWGAFTNTQLGEHLRQQGITQVVILGVATSMGVESTARHAHELGFNVTLATDAMTDMNGDAHANSITRIFPKIGEAGTTQEIIDLLDRVRD